MSRFFTTKAEFLTHIGFSSTMFLGAMPSLAEVQDALWQIYQASDELALAMETRSSGFGQFLDVEFASDTFKGSGDEVAPTGEHQLLTPTWKISIDPSVLADVWQFADNGTLVRVSLTRAIAHELMHAVLGASDPFATSATSSKLARDWLSTPDSDWIGDALVKENELAPLLGSSWQRVGYFNNIGSGFLPLPAELTTSVSFTGGNTFNRVFTDKLTSSNATLDVFGTLVSDGDVGVDILDFSALSGNVLTLGLDGRDYVAGLQGNDFIYGGTSNDTLSGNAGDDFIHGGDLYRAFSGDGTDTVRYAWHHGYLKNAVSTAAGISVTQFTSYLNVDPSHGITIDARASAVAGAGDLLPSVLIENPSAANKVIVVTDDGFGFSDTLFSIERVVLPGGKINSSDENTAAQQNTIIKTDKIDWSGVRFYDSAASNQIDSIQIKHASGTAPSGGEATQFHYLVDPNVRNAGVTINIDANADSQARLDNLFYVTNATTGAVTQLKGGVRFVYNEAEFKHIDGRNLTFLSSPPETATLGQMYEIAGVEADKQVAAWIAAHPKPPASTSLGGYSLTSWNVAIENIRSAVWSNVSWAYDLGAAYDIRYGELREVYVPGVVRADGTRFLEVEVGDGNGNLVLRITIDNWRDGDFGIRLNEKIVASPETAGNSLFDSPEDILDQTIAAALRAEGFLPTEDDVNKDEPPSTGPNTPNTPTDPVETRTGNADSNTLTGGNNDDLLVGGGGNDTLKGGAGRDTYYFKPGDGIDTIVETAGGTNTVVFGSGAGTVTVEKGGGYGIDDLVVSYGGGADKVVIAGWFASAQALGWTIRFADGTCPALEAGRWHCAVVEIASRPWSGRLQNLV